MSKPVDKKLYKGTNPSCHDFNETVAMPDGAPLLVGFTTGQIQLVQPGKREPGRLFNEEVCLYNFFIIHRMIELIISFCCCSVSLIKQK